PRTLQRRARAPPRAVRARQAKSSSWSNGLLTSIHPVARPHGGTAASICNQRLRRNRDSFRWSTRPIPIPSVRWRPAALSSSVASFWSASGHILVDVQTRDEVAVVNPRTRHVVRREALPGCRHDHGLYVDAPRRVAFVACDRNAVLLTLDLEHVRVIRTATVGSNPDVLVFDTSSRRLYVAAESGDVAVFQERGRRLTKLGQFLLAPAAHTVAVDPRTHLAYFPLERGRTGRPELRIMRQATQR